MTSLSVEAQQNKTPEKTHQKRHSNEIAHDDVFSFSFVNLHKRLNGESLCNVWQSLFHELSKAKIAQLCCVSKAQLHSSLHFFISSRFSSRKNSVRQIFAQIKNYQNCHSITRSLVSFGSFISLFESNRSQLVDCSDATNWESALRSELKWKIFFGKKATKA